MTLVLLITLISTTAALAATPKRINDRREHVVGALDRGLAGTPMAHTGRALEASGHKHHVNPALIAAIAGVESSYGALACRSNRHNAFGLGSCSSGWVPAFRSWAHVYDFFARWVRERFPTARSPYDFHGYCVDAYGNDCPTWPDKVSAGMRRFGSGPNITYGRS